MSVKIRKATENSLYSLENHTKYVFSQWFNDIHKSMKEQENIFRDKLIKSCVSQFSKEYSIEDEDLDGLHKSLLDTCSKHKFGKLKINCPNFIINHQHTEEDVKKTEKGGEMEDYKKFVFKVNKKKEVVDRKPRKAVTVYQLFQSDERSKMKKDGMNTEEIRESLKKKWEEFKKNSENFSELKKKADEMKVLPNKKVSNSNGLGRSAYHVFSGYEKKSFKETRPNASKEDIQEHLSKKWKEIKNNEKQYNEYLKMAEEKKNKKDENDNGDNDNEEKKKKGKEKKEKKVKGKKGKEKKKDDDEEEKDVDEEIMKNEDEVKIDDDDSEVDLGVSDPEHSDDDSDAN